MDPSDKFDYQDLFGSDMDLDANDTGSSSGITGDLVSRAGTDENQHVGQPGQTVPVPGEAVCALSIPHLPTFIPRSLSSLTDITAHQAPRLTFAFYISGPLP